MASIFLKSKGKGRSMQLVVFALLLFLMGSCASANRFYAHGGKNPIWVKDGYRYYIDGVEQTVYEDIYKSVVNTTENATYTVTTTTTTYAPALRVAPTQKYVTIERVDANGNRSLFLCRRKPTYLYFWLDQYLTADIGTLVDIADGLIYDWEVVASTDLKK